MDEAKQDIDKELKKNKLERKVDDIKHDIKKTINPTFWDRNKDAILVGSGVAIGSFLMFLSLRK